MLPIAKYSSPLEKSTEVTLPRGVPAVGQLAKTLEVGTCTYLSTIPKESQKSEEKAKAREQRWRQRRRTLKHSSLAGRL